MRRGAFEAAWAISDAVLRARAGVPCWHWPRHLQYIWDGTPLTGKRVLVRCYHGLGDTIQFIRYAPGTALPPHPGRVDMPRSHCQAPAAVAGRWPLPSDRPDVGAP